MTSRTPREPRETATAGWQEQARNPEPLTVDLGDNLSVATVDSDDADLTTFDGHIYADASGKFPASLNSWESDIVAAEVDQASVVGWYRNPSRATPAALRIAYQTDAGDWTSLQPNFIIVSHRDDGSFGTSIIDPHGDYFADTRNKLLALADYAEHYSNQFVRMESVSETSTGLRSLDLQDEAVRSLMRSFEGSEVASLYESELSSPYLTKAWSISHCRVRSPAEPLTDGSSPERKYGRHICRSCGPADWKIGFSSPNRRAS